MGNLQRWVWIEGTAMFPSCVGKRGGWYPKTASKVDIPVAEKVRELWAYSAQARCVLYVEGLLAMMQHRMAYRPWLVRFATISLGVETR